MIDQQRLQQSLDSLADEPADGDDLGAALTRVADATKVLFDADGAGVMLIDEDQALNNVNSDDPRARLLETAQRDLGKGPCVDCLVLDHPVHTTDVMHDDRWVGLPELLEPSGIRAILGVPVRIAGGAIGSLNVFRLDQGDWSAEETLAIAAYAGVVEDLIGAALLARDRGELAGQLQRALDSRVVIERAVGFRMASEGVGAVTAFDQLRRQARAERRKVTDVAEDVLGAQ